MNTATVLAVAIFAAPIAAFLAYRAVAPVAVIAAVVILVLESRRRRVLFPIPQGLLLTAACIFVAWALLSTVWALDGGLAIRGTMTLTGNLLVGLFLFDSARKLDEAERSRIFIAALTGLIVTLCLVTVDIGMNGAITIAIKGGVYNSAYGLFWLNGCAAILALYLWPLAANLFATGKWWVVVVLFVATILAMNFLGYMSGMAALCVGVVSAVIALGGRRVLLGMAVLTVCAVISAPLLPGRVLDPISIGGTPELSVPKAAVHRLHIWDFAAKRIGEQPLLGWGMNSSRVMPGGKTEVTDKFRNYGQSMPLHPHNFVLQVWLELGAVGALMLAFFCGGVFFALLHNGWGRVRAAFAVGQFTTALALLTFSFGIWQSWWLASLWLAASLLVALVGPGSKGNWKSVDPR